MCLHSAAINNGVGELLTSAVLVGTSAASNINLINAKTVAGTKVTMNSEPGGCDSIKVFCLLLFFFFLAMGGVEEMCLSSSSP